jgi:hypothetical protein
MVTFNEKVSLFLQIAIRYSDMKIYDGQVIWMRKEVTHRNL